MALGFQIGRIPFLGLRRQPTEAELLISQATVLNDYSPTFTRASTAFDPYNRVTAASGARRRRPLPINAGWPIFADLIEGSRTNLCLRSQDLNNASWSKTDQTITTGAGTAPDGTTTLDLVTEGTAGTAALQQSQTITAGSVVSLCLLIKASANVQFVRLQYASNANANGFRSWVDLAAGTISAAVGFGTGSAATQGIESLGGGLYRAWIVGKVDSAATAATIVVASAASSGSTTRVNSAAYLAGWVGVEQMAASATSGFPSSYIATTTATVTRAADALSVPYVLGQTGTILALCVPYGWTSDQDGVTFWRTYEANDTNTSGGRRSNATSHSVRRCDAGGVESAGVVHSLTNGSLNHLGQTWDASAVTAFSNGVAGGSDTSLTPPYNTNTTVTIGAANGGGSNLFGHVALLAWPRALSASELLALYAALPAAA